MVNWGTSLPMLPEITLSRMRLSKDVSHLRIHKFHPQFAEHLNDMFNWSQLDLFQSLMEL